MYKGLSEGTKKQSKGMKRKFRRNQRVIRTKWVIKMYQMGNQKVSTEQAEGTKVVCRRYQRSNQKVQKGLTRI